MMPSSPRILQMMYLVNQTGLLCSSSPASAGGTSHTSGSTSSLDDILGDSRQVTRQTSVCVDCDGAGLQCDARTAPNPPVNTRFSERLCWRVDSSVSIPFDTDSFMKSVLLAVATLSCFSLIGCDSDGDTAEPTGAVDLVLPEAGVWSVITTGYTNDDCGAAGFLIPPDSITFSDVGDSYFSITYYLENERIGEGSVLCSHLSEDTYDCESMNHSTPFSASTTISMVATGTVTMTSETSASGSGDLILECSGSDCDQVASMTTIGSMPCETTLNWTAAPN